MTTIVGDHADLLVVRRVGTAVPHPLVLEARWPGQPDGAVLAGLRPDAAAVDPRNVRR